MLGLFMVKIHIAQTSRKMKKPNPVEHYVFVVRAWRTDPESPWEFVLHYSGTDQVEYAQNQSELLSALNRRLQEEAPPSAVQRLAA